MNMKLEKLVFLYKDMFLFLSNLLIKHIDLVLITS